MFGFFSKKPSLADSINACTAFAKKANIDVVMENGNYSGFLIFLDEDVSLLVDHFKNKEAISAFVGAIEEKLSNRQFNDPSDGIDMVVEMREMTGWEPNMNVVRAVFARGNKPVFRWEP